MSLWRIGKELIGLGPMWRSRSVAVIVPAFNEARLIQETLRRIPDYVDQVFVVDDASTDTTSEQVQELHAARVECLRHTENRGVGAAIVTGYRAALAGRADVLVVMAGDNQMDPGDLPALLDAVTEHGVDYAKGNRFLHQEAKRMPALRRLGSRFLSWLTRVTTSLDVDDCQCGFTALTAGTARQLDLDSVWPRYGYPNDVLALLAAVGARVSDVAVRPVYADESSGLRARHMFGITLRIVKRGFWLTQNSRHSLKLPNADS